MAPLNFKCQGAGPRDFQALIIEDSWEGTIYLQARVIKTWQGLCGSNKLLEDREGRFYWWSVLSPPDGGQALQRVVSFLDWDSMAAELGITESWGQDARVEMAGSIH
jgi:hypothetical protein